MSSPAFDAYVMVDWSAAKTPKTGKDSIWIACVSRAGDGLLALDVLENPPTRAQATARLVDLLDGLAGNGKRVLAGFDFPFGYPRGTGAALGHDGLVWRRTWADISDLLEDAEDNANNRFRVAEILNRRLGGGPAPFWGRVDGETGGDLPARKSDRIPNPLPERRLCENRVPSTKTVWQLAYNGSVGSQVLTGLPRLWQLRTDARLAFRAQIWPFETGLRDDPTAEIVLAEVYPSLVPPDPLPDLPKDAGQVSAMARALAQWDAAGRLDALFAADPALTPDERRVVEEEEAWILGVTDRPEPVGAGGGARP
jgi:precorrin-8X/cobalt-precorrin-8 methylmutase